MLENFSAEILSFMVRILSLGLIFDVFVIFGFRPIFGRLPAGVKIWKPDENFSVFEVKYLDQKLLTSKKFFS